VVSERPMHAGNGEGMAKTWYDDGKKRSEGQYSGGLLQGTLVFWYPDGKKKYEGGFSQGRPDGVVSEYYPSGKEKSRITWKAGQPAGPMTRWYDNGQMEVDGIVKDGKITGLHMWSRDGKPVTHPKFDPRLLAGPHPSSAGA
jgi:antitoxin component YwqK of YwqJK toxin-antitoxin module